MMSCDIRGDFRNDAGLIRRKKFEDEAGAHGGCLVVVSEF
jgi:hypothetical protein